MDQPLIGTRTAFYRYPALQTLDTMLLLIEVNRFSLWDLVRILNRVGDASSVEAEIAWLVRYRYVWKGPSSVYEISPKGFNRIR